MITLLKKLYQINILKPKGFYLFVKAALTNGTNLMSVLEFSAHLKPDNLAVHSSGESRTYSELRDDSRKLAIALKNNFNILPKNRVAIMCRNNLAAVQATYALSRLGVHIYFLNTEISQNQVSDVVQYKKIDLVIYDDALDEKFTACLAKILKSSEITSLIQSTQSNRKLKKVKAGDLVILSGGTTGKPKSAKRKPSIGDFLNPLVALLAQLKLNKYKSVYIATPFFHGFGLASLIMSVLLGSEIYLLEKFDDKKVCRLIESNKIEVVTLVPVMLKRMMEQNPIALVSLERIICGGAKLDQELAKQTLNELGDVLYNLYGTTEAGFSILANPESIKQNPLTIGRPIRGVSLKVVDENNEILKPNKIGQIHLSNSWMMNNSKESWINTDDLGYVAENGLVFLAGRSDNMIISGGENVYPDEVENILIEHPDINEVAVIGMDDPEFGQRLRAFVVPQSKSVVEDDILKWLKPKVARHQMPKQLNLISHLPRTAIGKIDKKELKTIKS